MWAFSYEQGTPVAKLEGTPGIEIEEMPLERVLYLQPTGPNPLNHRDNFSGPALRHDSLFQVALYLPS